MLIRHEIFTRVVDQLKTIKTANQYTLYGGAPKNYFTNLGDKVFPWRAATFQLGELPALIVRDLDEPVKESTPRSERVERSLHIQVEIVLAGEQSMDDLRKCYADVEAAIGVGRSTGWGNLTSNTRPRISRSVLEQDSAKVSGGIVEVFIDYPTQAFQAVI